MLLIYNELQNLRDFDANQKVFLETVMSLGEVAFTNAYSIDHAKVIKEKSARRQLIFLANKILRDSQDPTVEFPQLLANPDSAFRAISNTSTPNDLIRHHDYFSQFLMSDIATNKLYAERKTGFNNIDEQQIFSPGLYVIGATPAAGKTTFCWQLLEQLAQRGESCIFCSYEMSALELFSKTLARELFLQNQQTILTSADIRKGSYSQELESLIMTFINDKSKTGVDIFVLRDESVDDLLRLIKPHCSNKKTKSPVVCLDYLQIVPPSTNDNFPSDKARIDDIVHKLKTFQRETNTTFIVISSFNRTNYAQQVSFESFKESGHIEYTADVIWALQLNVVNELKGCADISEARKKFDLAKKNQPRQIHLKCVKNRQGSNYDCFFHYFSAHDYFQSVATFQNHSDSTSGNTKTVAQKI